MKTEDKGVQTAPAFLGRLDTVEQLTSCTGLNSFELFDSLVCGVEKYCEQYIPSLLVGKTLSIRDQVLLTFIKLKLNLSFTFISTLFHRVSRESCSRYFRRIIRILPKILHNFICTPTRDQVQDNLPSTFIQFKMCRWVLDCTEVPVCKPKCIRCRTQTYSYYKQRHTLKVLIGTTPCGLITHISSFYGGKASDKFIFNDTGLLEKCEPLDAVMVDKGFRIDEECTEADVTLIQPAFKE